MLILDLLSFWLKLTFLLLIAWLNIGVRVCDVCSTIRHTTSFYTEGPVVTLHYTIVYSYTLLGCTSSMDWQRSAQLDKHARVNVYVEFSFRNRPREHPI